MDYAGMLQQAQNSYSSILAGYSTTMAQQQSAQQGIMAGYNQLQSNVLNTIQGVDASQRQSIRDQYAQQSGAMQQGLISSGLGNTTVMGSMQRGLTLDEAKAETGLSNSFAQLAAGYQSQLGLAGLGYRGQAAQQNTALQQNMLGYMGQYAGQLGGWGMQGLGMDQQAQLAREQMANQLKIAQLHGVGGRGGGGGGGSSYPGGYGGYAPLNQGYGSMAPAGGLLQQSTYNAGTGPGARMEDPYSPYVNLTGYNPVPEGFDAPLDYGGGAEY